MGVLWEVLNSWNPPGSIPGDSGVAQSPVVPQASLPGSGQDLTWSQAQDLAEPCQPLWAYREGVLPGRGVNPNHAMVPASVASGHPLERRSLGFISAAGLSK